MMKTKNQMVQEAERGLTEAERGLVDARIRLRSAAAFHSFALGGNDAMARKMRALMLKKCPPCAPVVELAELYPAFRRHGELLLIASDAEAVA